MNNKQTKTWDKKEKCNSLQKRWGDYDTFPIKKNKFAIIDVLKDISINKLNNQGSFLEVGCGAGHFLWKIKNNVSKMVALDYSPHMIEIITKQFKDINTPLEVLNASCWNIPLKKKYVDVSYQIDVCMHVGGSWQSIKEMIRVSKKYIIFTGPSFEDFDDEIDKMKYSMSWSISISLLEEKLDNMIKNNIIKKYTYKHRNSTNTYKHRILVIER